MKNEDILEDNQEFEKLLEESFEDKKFNNDNVSKGSMVKGTVIKVLNDYVFLDLGLKTEGIIARDEFTNQNTPHIGDQMTAIVNNITPSEISLSFSKARDLSSMKQIENAHQNELIVTAKIMKIVKGGFIATIDGGIQAFVPFSHIDVAHITQEEQESFIGKTLEFLVLNLSQRAHSNIVLSRKQLLEKQIEEKKDEFMRTKKEGDIVTGKVKNYASFGVFIDLGGFDALLHMSDVSWGKSPKPTEIAPRDTTLEFKIIKMDRDTKKINLSLKALTPNPWDTINEHYAINQMVSGEVVKLLPYGIFLRLEDGIEGFIHVSDISWNQRIDHPSNVVKLHDKVECKILKIEANHKRISLGMKQLHENPWDNVTTTHPIGLKVPVTVCVKTHGGMIVELENGLQGFIAKMNYSWEKSPSTQIEVGEVIDAKVLGYEENKKELKLGIKQLLESPWEKEGLKKGSIVEGTIVNIADFGVFLKITDDIEGLIPKSQAYNPHEYASYEEARKSFVKGETIQAMVQQVNLDTNNITLSIKSIQVYETKKELNKHLIDDDTAHHSVSLGDLIDYKNNTTTTE